MDLQTKAFEIHASRLFVKLWIITKSLNEIESGLKALCECSEYLRKVLKSSDYNYFSDDHIYVSQNFI